MPFVWRVSSFKMDAAIRDQTIDGSICISNITYTFAKGMNPIIQPAAMGKYLAKLDNLTLV